MGDPNERVEPLFAASLEMADRVKRAAYLQQACVGDETLRREVESLLTAHERAGDFLETPAALPPLPLSGPGGTAWDSDPITNQPDERIGSYELLAKIGEGGCGAVYLAQQNEPVRRRVALKIIKLGMDSRQVVARFEAERQALALMDHPNIARVFEGGTTETGRPYFVMELVRGTRMTHYCDENQLPIRDRLALFIQVCHAIQHAHQKGVVHRDIKPSNILVVLHDGPASAGCPKIIDFGIAKALEQPLTDKTVFTALDQFIGTPIYMSPEQAGLSGLDIDTRSDIYSLGVLLYELLTGRTPFESKELQAGLDEMRRTIREKEPVKPSTRLTQELAALGAQRRGKVGKWESEKARDAPVSAPDSHSANFSPAHFQPSSRRDLHELQRLISALRGDLDWIVMKCLEKDRSRRYETANGLARDLERYLANEPIVARPPSAAYRFQKWVRRHKLAFAAASAVAVVLVLGVIVSSGQAFRATRAERVARAAQQKETQQRQAAELARAQAEDARNTEAQQRQQAQAQELEARRMAYASDVNLAQQAIAANNFGRAKRLLDGQRPKQGQRDLRNWEWRYLWQQVQSDALQEVTREPWMVGGVTFSPDGKLLAGGGWHGGSVRVWDLSKRQLIAVIPNTERVGRALAFAPRGDLLAVARTEGRTNRFVSLWDTKTWQEVGRLPQNRRIEFLTFSPDAKFLATHFGGLIRVWDVEHRTRLSSFNTGLQTDGNFASVIAFSPDAKLIATTGFSEVRGSPVQLKLFDWVAQTERLSISDSREQIQALAISPEGTLLASSTGYKEAPIKLWDLQTGKEVGELAGHRAWVSWLSFSPDGTTLASASADQTVRLWDVRHRREVASFRGHTEEVYTLTFSPDGRTLASGGKDGSIQLWDATPKEGRKAFVALANGRIQEFSHDGSSYAVEETNGWFAVYDNATGMQKDRFLQTNCWGVAFSPRGDLLTFLRHRRESGGGPNPMTIQVRDLKTHNVVTNIATDGMGAVGWSTTGRTLATLGWGTNASLRFWDSTSWHERFVLALPSEAIEPTIFPFQTQISFDDRMLGCIDKDGAVSVFEIATGSRITSFRPHLGHCSGLALSPDSSLMATCGENGEAKLWDTATWQPKHVLRGHLLSVSSVSFSPDGRRLATGGSWKEAVKLWDVDTGQELATFEGQGRSTAVMFSADGRSLSAGTRNLWRAPIWAEIETAERAVRTAPSNANAQELEAAASRQIHSAEEQSRAARAHDPGAIKQWLVLAPVPLTLLQPARVRQTGVQALENSQIDQEGQVRPRAGERFAVAGNELIWQAIQLQDSVIDFNAVLRLRSSGGKVAYAVAYIISESEQHGLQMLVGSEDQAKVYLNGEEVYRSASLFRGFFPDEDQVLGVRLNQGTNIVVFKVVDDPNYEGGRIPQWKGSIRFTDKEGKPVDGIKVTLTPP